MHAEQYGVPPSSDSSREDRTRTRDPLVGGGGLTFFRSCVNPVANTAQTNARTDFHGIHPCSCVNPVADTAETDARTGLEVVLFDKASQQFGQVRLPDLLEIVEDPGVGLLDVDDAVEIDGCADHHRIAVRAVDRGFEIP